MTIANCARHVMLNNDSTKDSKMLPLHLYVSVMLSIGHGPHSVCLLHAGFLEFNAWTMEFTLLTLVALFRCRLRMTLDLPNAFIPCYEECVGLLYSMFSVMHDGDQQERRGSCSLGNIPDEVP